MAIGSRICPDCERRVSRPFQPTVTGRLVCPDCAAALASGVVVAGIQGDPGLSFSVWAMLQRRIRRTQ